MPEIPDGSQKQIARGDEKVFKKPLSNLLSRIRSVRQPNDVKPTQAPSQEPRPFHIELGRDINQLYEELIQHEASPANRDETIRVVRMNPSKPESNQFQSAEIEASALQAGRVTRGALLDAGYVFLNRIGGGEKPLISAQVPVGVEGGVQTVDMGKKILLTQVDLDAVIQHQKSKPGEYTTESADMGLIRKDMLLFLQQAIGEQNNLVQKANAVFRAAQGRIFDNPKYVDEDREALRKFFAKLYEEYQKTGSSNLGFIMQECMAGIDVAWVRGLPFEIFPIRLSALQGAPSPFLDSGFHFDTNYDVTLYPHNSSQTRRLNMAVIHLLSRGLNEMGESKNESRDQHYLTAGEYEKNIYGKSEATEVVSDNNLDMIASRLLFRANAA
jgi:hypothetical protein